MQIVSLQAMSKDDLIALLLKERQEHSDTLDASGQGFLDSPNHNQAPKEPYRTTKNCVELISKSIRPRRVGYGWDDESTPSNKIIIQLMAKYHLQMLMGSDYEKVMDFGRDVFNFATKNHIPDAREMIVPEGWQLVPKEPSRDMLKKMFYEVFGMDGIEEEYLAARYRNMLSSFPKYTGAIND